MLPAHLPHLLALSDCALHVLACAIIERAADSGGTCEPCGGRSCRQAGVDAQTVGGNMGLMVGRRGKREPGNSLRRFFQHLESALNSNILLSTSYLLVLWAS